MPNELKPLSDIFNQSIFRIPDYQRGYAWTTDQLVDFWDDLINLPQNQNHYTGLLSIKRVMEIKDDDDKWLIQNKGYKLYHIVDGQQRLTTFSILLHEILDFVSKLAVNKGKNEDGIYFCDSSIREIREKYISKRRPPNYLITTFLFGYDKDNPSNKYLIHRIYDEPNGGTIEESYYTKNLAKAKSFFADNIGELYKKSGEAALSQLFIKLTQQFKFNIHEIDTDYDVYVAFETMNNRGKRLSNLELLKNRLIYLTTLYDESEADAEEKNHIREDINNAWKEIYYQLGRNKDSLPDDEFLRAHWITYYKYSRKKGDDYIHFLLKRFSAKNVFAEHSVLAEQHEDAALTDYVEVEEVVKEQETEEETDSTHVRASEIDDYVKSLQQFAEYWYYSWFPLDPSFKATEDEKSWLDRLNRIGIGYFRPLVVAVLSTSKTTTVNERIELYKAVERFIFISFRVAGYQANYLSSDYYNKSREVMKGEVKVSAVAAELNKLVDNDNSAINYFIARVKKMFDSGSGFYSWWGLRYFLYEYEMSLTAKNGLQRDGNLSSWRLFTTSEKDKISIEHILPQTPTDWYWQNQFRKFNQKEIEVLAGSLGNLLPLSQSINSSLQNDSFDEKKNPTNTKRRGYAHGSHSEIEVSSIANWDADEIYARGVKLIKFLSLRWNVAISNDQTDDLLNIKFVKDNRAAVPELPMVLGKDYAKYIESLLAKEASLTWIGRWEHIACFSTAIIDSVPRGNGSPWQDERQAQYEVECCPERGITVCCKIFSRSNSVCDSIFSKSLQNSSITNIPYGNNGETLPTRRKKYVTVYTKNLLLPDEYSKGLVINKMVLKQIIADFIKIDLPIFEQIIK